MCPERLPPSDDRGNLYLTGLCGGYPEREALRIAIEKNGYIAVNAKVYEALIYFKVNRKTVAGDYPVIDEGYAPIDRQDFEALIRGARASKLSNESVIEEPQPRPDRDYRGDSSADLARVYDLVFQVLGLEALAAAPESCNERNGLSGYLLLRYEYGPPIY